MSCGTRMSCGGVSKSKILERFLGFGVSYVHRMTPNGVETASVAPYSLALSNSQIFSSQFGVEAQHQCWKETLVLGKESSCAKLIGALWLINQAPQSPLENSAQDGWSTLQLYQITTQVPSVLEPFPFLGLLFFVVFFFPSILHKPPFHTNADSAPLSRAKVTFTLKGH